MSFRSVVRKYAFPLLRFGLAAYLVWHVFENLWAVNFERGGIPAFGAIDESITRENYFEPLRQVLIANGYRTGALGYINGRSVRGEPRTDDDFVYWAQYRFVAIPYQLVRDVNNSPYVIGDFTEDLKLPATPPEGLVMIANPGTGLVLYKRIRQ